MSIQKTLKWMTLVGAGFLVSGCVASQVPANPGDVAYSDAVPGNFVADPSYPGGGYYEVVEFHEDPYYYGPTYGTFGTTIFLNSFDNRKHRRHDKHLPRSKKLKKKVVKKNTGKKPLTAAQIEARERRQAIRDQRLATREDRVAARQERRTARQERRADCRDAGLQNCRSTVKVAKTDTAAATNSKRRIRPASKRRRARN